MDEHPAVHSRQEVLNQAVSQYVRKGYRVVNAYGWTVTLERGRKVNHLLHFLIGLFTLSVWWFVWIFLIFFNQHRIITVTVDEWMNVQVTRA